jgi:hypothetical protein
MLVKSKQLNVNQHKQNHKYKPHQSLTMWVLQLERFYEKPKPLTIEDQEFIIPT